MAQFSYRLALVTVLLAMSLAMSWTAVAGASRYIDRPGTGGSQADAVAANRAGASFDWVDAGIGAATTVGLGLVVAGTCALVLRRRRAAFS